jgi:tRNA G18 (ribose-2'-O)-methylase SpoU
MESGPELREREREVRGGDGADIRRLPVAVLLEDVRSLWNVGSIFRTADACGVGQLVLTGITGYPPRQQIAKTALGAEEAVPWRYRADPQQALEQLVADSYSPVAIETSSRAVSLEEMQWPHRICLVVGNEVAGVSPQILDACPQHVFIPMRGVKDSMNVAVAFGIAAYHASRALTGAARESSMHAGLKGL